MAVPVGSGLHAGWERAATSWHSKECSAAHSKLRLQQVSYSHAGIETGQQRCATPCQSASATQRTAKQRPCLTSASGPAPERAARKRSGRTASCCWGSRSGSALAGAPAGGHSQLTAHCSASSRYLRAPHRASDTWSRWAKLSCMQLQQCDSACSCSSLLCWQTDRGASLLLQERNAV